MTTLCEGFTRVIGASLGELPLRKYQESYPAYGQQQLSSAFPTFSSSSRLQAEFAAGLAAHGPDASVSDEESLSLEDSASIGSHFSSSEEQMLFFADPVQQPFPNGSYSAEYDMFNFFSEPYVHTATLTSVGEEYGSLAAALPTAAAHENNDFSPVSVAPREQLPVASNKIAEPIAPAAVLSSSATAPATRSRTSGATTRANGKSKRNKSGRSRAPTLFDLRQQAKHPGVAGPYIRDVPTFIVGV